MRCKALQSKQGATPIKHNFNFGDAGRWRPEFPPGSAARRAGVLAATARAPGRSYEVPARGSLEMQEMLRALHRFNEPDNPICLCFAFSRQATGIAR
jgi:hypothetical protein